MAYDSPEDRKNKYRRGRAMTRGKGRAMIPHGRDMVPYKKPESRTYPMIHSPRRLGTSPSAGKNPLTNLPPVIRGSGKPPVPPQSRWQKALGAAGRYGKAFLRSPLGRSSIYATAGYAAYEGQDWLFKHLNRQLDAKDKAGMDAIMGHIPPHRERYPAKPVGPPKGPAPTAPTPPPSAGPGPGTAPPKAPVTGPPSSVGPKPTSPSKRPTKRKKGGRGGSAKAASSGYNWQHIALGALGGYALNTLMKGSSSGGGGSGGYNYYESGRRSGQYSYFR